MQQPGYQQGSERAWWWKVAKHLDETNLALGNALAHNLDDPTLPLAFGDAIRQAQAILLEIFRAKNLLPGGPVPPPKTEMPTGPVAAGGSPLSGGGPPGWIPQFPQGPLPQQAPPPPSWIPQFPQAPSPAPDAQASEFSTPVEPEEVASDVTASATEAPVTVSATNGATEAPIVPEPEVIVPDEVANGEAPS